MSVQAIDLKSQAFKLAEAGQHKKAFKLIENYQPQSSVEARILGHGQAEVFMLLGQTKEALDLLLETRQKHGEHISLLTDIALCYYALSDFKNWKIAFEGLKRAYEAHKDLLAFERRSMAELNLARFYEEEGEVAVAADLYLKLMREMEERQDVARFFRVMSQAMRVMSTFKMSNMLATTYRRMISVGKIDVSFHASIDVQHALLLSELTLVGPQNAGARLLEILRTDGVILYDKQLLYFNFLEECLVQGHAISEKLVPFATLFKDLNPFEKEIHRLAIDRCSDVKLVELDRLTLELPTACYLRVIGAYLSSVNEVTAKTELRLRLISLINCLSVEARELWLSRYKHHLVAKEDTTISFDVRGRSLTSKQKSVSLARRRGATTLAELLVKSNEVDCDKAIACIWGVSLDEASFKNLRLTVHRLNEAIFDLTGINDVLEINKQKISVRGHVKFRGVENV